MELLLSGLGLFLASHFIPSFPKFRERLIHQLTPGGYKAIFSLLSLIAIVLIVNGLKQAPFLSLYEPPNWGRHVTMLLMLLAVYLFLSNSMGPAPSTAKFISAHPLNWGVIVWAIAHLLTNGDLAHVLLFCSMGLFAGICIVTGNRRGLQPNLQQRPAVWKEAVFMLIVAVVYIGLVWGHGYFTGMALIHF